MLFKSLNLFIFWEKSQICFYSFESWRKIESVNSCELELPYTYSSGLVKMFLFVDLQILFL